MKSYKRIGLLLALPLLVALPVVAQSTTPTEEKIQLNLMAQANRVHTLAPSAPIVEETIAIDEAGQVELIFGSPSKTLKIELISPSGQRFSSGNTNSAGVRSLIYPDPADPNTTGANYVFALSKPQAGKWKYTIQDSAPLTKSRTVLLSLLSSSPVRAGMYVEPHNRVNQDIRVALVTVDGQNILKNPLIKATVAKVDDPAFPQSAVNFHDDGANGDEVAGDGLFTASFKSEVPGKFQVYADIEGTSSQGSPFQRDASTTFKVQEDRAHFSRSFTNRGIDSNGDGLFEQIGVSPTVEVLEGGEYEVAVTLKASNGESITSRTVVNLPTGTATPEVKFASRDIKDFLKVNGPYLVSRAFLWRSDIDKSATLDEVFDLGSTAAYNIAQLQRQAIELSGGGTAIGVDTNGNGKFEYLDVTIPVDLLSSNYYNWGARLVDKNSKQIDLIAGSGYLSTGNSSVTLRFNGAAIGENGIDGPYSVEDLIVYGGGKSIRVDDALSTQHFQASQFEGFALADKEPPKLNVSVTPNTLWPPNHQMVEIKVNMTVSDNVDPNPIVKLESITSNEGQNVQGDGNTSTDIEVKPNGQVFLRAERSGNGTGRLYTLTYTARDAAGNTTQATAQVKVPRNQGK
jgi:hypothetical protein